MATCTVAEQRFALDLADVDEILMMAQLCAVPHAPTFLLGSLNLRGTPVPILDLCERMGTTRPPAPAAELSPYRRGCRILLTHLGEIRVGVLVDSIADAEWVAEENLRSGVLEEGLPDYVDGLWLSPGGQVQIVDLPQILNAEERAWLRKLQGAQAP